MIEPGRIKPMDAYNEKLVSNAHPPNWVNPDPADCYNLVVIGAGPGGLVAAAGAAGVGAKVALVEKHLIGGDCLNVGCVPSKCLIRSSRAASEARLAEGFGVGINGDVEVDFPAVVERMRRIRAGISAHDSAARFRDIGVDVFIGEGKFADDRTVDVDGCRLRFNKAVVATGARAVKPDIPGIEDVEVLTNENVFELTELPPRLAVFGAGPLGCELAQAFRRFGSEVIIIEKMGRLLMREDPDAAEIIARSFERDGIAVKVNSTVDRVENKETAKLLRLQNGGRSENIAVDAILVGVGRAPNVQGLNLEAAGVEYDDRLGVQVDDRMRTTNKRIFGCGDVCQREKFTHTADAAARIVIRNALFAGRNKYSRLVIPWCTYTDPEIAHVGMYEREAEERGLKVDTFELRFDQVDRALADGAADGLIKVHIRRGSDQILGATIVAEHAGEMINEITLAIVAGIGLGKLSDVIHPYPTQAEAIRKIADAYNRTRLRPFIKSIFNRYLAWRRC